MPQTQISCPRCRQPIPALIEQLFDVTADPGAKQRLLGGVSNRARCPHCGYEGALATPIVYHDADKELLLTYFPPELGLPVNEQERMIGPLINQVMNRLPPEKRKAYLLKPQNHLTMQSLIERILGADGITPEMLKAQQERVALLERLLSASSDDVRAELVRQNDALIDDQFFALFSRLAQNAAAGGQENVLAALGQVQQQLLAHSTFGRKLQSSVNEMEAAARSLKEAGRSLTREKLLDLLIEAPNEERVSALVSLARPGMDYMFFQLFSDRIERAGGAEQKRLADLRARVLELIDRVDAQVQEAMQQARQFLEQILSAPDIAAATRQNLEQFNDAVIQVLNDLLNEAARKQDVERLKKLQQVVAVLQEASAPPPEYELIEKLINAPDDAAMERMLAEQSGALTPKFLELLGSLVAQTETPRPDAGEEDRIVAARLQTLYRLALKESMKRKLQQ